MIRHAIPLATVVSLVLSGCGQQSVSLQIAVIPKGTTHEFWKSVEAGAKAAAQDLGVEVVWKGPINEGDRVQQINLVQDFVARRVAGICVAPLDFKALVGPVEEAVAAGVPVVVFDSALESAKPISYVATDNREGGRIAGRHMAKLLGGAGKVLLLRYMEGSASTMEREAGFLETAKAGGLTIVDDTQYAGPDRSQALAKSKDVLARLGKDLDGIFTPNESSTAGMMLALQQDHPQLLAKVTHLGFDTAKDLIQALRDGRIKGLVAQNPRRMGYLAVQGMVKHLRGQLVDKVIDTGATLVTPENLMQADIQELLTPEIRAMLGKG